MCSVFTFTDMYINAGVRYFIHVNILFVLLSDTQG